MKRTLQLNPESQLVQLLDFYYVYGRQLIYVTEIAILFEGRTLVLFKFLGAFKLS